MSSTLFDIPFPPVATTVFVVRHAHVHNPRDLLYGRLPRFRLSEEGERQAREAARFLASRHLSAMYSSPLLRARQTARIIAELQPGLRVHLSRDLLETKSSFAGEPNSILKPGFSFYEPKRAPSDESMEDIWRRMSRILSAVVRRHVGGTVALVSHADPITILRMGLEGRELTVKNLHAGTYVGRGSITQLVFLPDTPLMMSYFNVGESSDQRPSLISRSESA